MYDEVKTTAVSTQVIAGFAGVITGGAIAVLVPCSKLGILAHKFATSVAVAIVGLIDR